MLQWTWGCTYLFKMIILFPLDIYPEVGLMDHRVVLNFWGTSILYSPSGCTNLDFHQQCTRFSFFFFTHSSIFTISCLFGNYYCKMCEVVSHYGWFAFPRWLVLLDTVSALGANLFFVFGKMSMYFFVAVIVACGSS